MAIDWDHAVDTWYCTVCDTEFEHGDYFSCPVCAEMRKATAPKSEAKFDPNAYSPLENWEFNSNPITDQINRLAPIFFQVSKSTRIYTEAWGEVA